MSRKWLKAKEKSEKKANAEKKKRRKTILICIFTFILIFSAVILIYQASGKDSRESEIYSYYGQTVQLLPDGTFTASLAHNVRKKGTYVKSEGTGRTVVTFNVNGTTETGSITGTILHLPTEWDDNHGHGTAFPRTK